MRLACDACGETGAFTASVHEAMVQVHCARCHACAEVPVRAHGGVADDPALEVPRCPKCRAAYGERAACPGCGLSVARMPGFASARAHAAPPDGLAAWQAVLAAWSAQERHDAFVQLLAASGRFAWGAGQYQDALTQRPGDAIAARQLERVRRTAEAAMLASAVVRPGPTARPYRSATAILVMLVVVLVAGALYATFMRDTRVRGRAASPAVPVVPASRGAAPPRSVAAPPGGLR